MLPFENSAGPETETDGGKLVPAFCAATASATRPAHPVDAELDGMPACICTCWSACENRLVGNGMAGPPVMAPWYCACVVGCTSNPTLATRASCPVAQ